MHVGFQDGWTPLHFAAWCGHEGIIDALYGAGADVNARDQVGPHYLSLSLPFSCAQLCVFYIYSFTLHTSPSHPLYFSVCALVSLSNVAYTCCAGVPLCLHGPLHSQAVETFTFPSLLLVLCFFPFWGKGEGSKGIKSQDCDYCLPVVKVSHMRLPCADLSGRVF